MAALNYEVTNMKQINVFALSLIFLLLSGCGTNFVRPTDDALLVGKSTRANVIQLLGKPSDVDDEKIVNDEPVETITYSYHLVKTIFTIGAPDTVRTQTYTFFNDIMVGSEFTSTFAADITEFDATKLKAISIGKSTKADVITVFGRPSGEGIYPFIKYKNVRAIVYSYTETRDFGFAKHNNKNLMIFILDNNDFVSKISYLIDGEEQIKS
jgi:outer membrane protein assembly factor BamE (lipoprotein component of BamABCDE complex)